MTITLLNVRYHLEQHKKETIKRVRKKNPTTIISLYLKLVFNLFMCLKTEEETFVENY